MSKLRWMLGISLRERRRNEDIRTETKVASIVEKIRESRLRWLRHVMRRDEDDPVKEAWELPVEDQRSVGRQRLKCKDMVEEDMRKKNIRKEGSQDRPYWRRRTRMADPSWD
ncbi:uncharacterized protein LOC135690948 [Rhopilema esculentum]|uniref:uncharacterized protein LOC135690948 n=1 Tax=Rhopilema esculentum TaxID=499914 RepID=UPI0031D33AA4|eukprot:gene1675-16151_t